MLIILTTGSLLYFGVFDIDRLRGSDCVFPAGVFCEDYYIGPALDGSGVPEVRVRLRNSYGVAVELDGMRIAGMLSGERDCDLDGSPPPFDWGRDETVEISCLIDPDAYVRRQRYDITFTGTFTQQGHTYVHVLRGWLSANAQ